jgi:hypothetical protein
MKMKNLKNSDQRLLKKINPFMLIGLALLFTAQLSAQTGAVNFSGTWALNESKSKFGDAQFRMAASLLTVKQEGNNLAIDRTSSGPDGQEMKTTGKYTLDGKESENAGFMDSKTKSTVKWLADNKSITIASTTVFNMNGDSMEMKATETWTLDGDKILKIETSNTMPDGEMKTSLVYDKK